MPALRTTRLRVLACALALGALMTAAPTASADCGQSIIDSYFSTGSIGYHSQACYAAALSEVDADAKMYSGIMGAIRSARARDAAADAAKAGSGSAGGGEVGASSGATTTAKQVDAEAAGTAHLATIAASGAAADGAMARDASLPAAEAAAVAAAADPGPPLAVILLAGLGVLLAVVGGAGLAVRRLERRS